MEEACYKPIKKFLELGPRAFEPFFQPSAMSDEASAASAVPKRPAEGEEGDAKRFRSEGGRGGFGGRGRGGRGRGRGGRGGGGGDRDRAEGKWARSGDRGELKRENALFEKYYQVSVN